VWDTWKKIESSVDASLGVETPQTEEKKMASSETPVDAASPPALQSQVVKNLESEFAQDSPERATATDSPEQDAEVAEEEKKEEPKAETEAGPSRVEEQLMRLAARNAQLEAELEVLKTPGKEPSQDIRKGKVTH
jgi:hypothetical protein